MGFGWAFVLGWAPLLLLAWVEVVLVLEPVRLGLGDAQQLASSRSSSTCSFLLQ
jgi:hypothetical protein